LFESLLTAANKDTNAGSQCTQGRAAGRLTSKPGNRRWATVTAPLQRVRQSRNRNREKALYTAFKVGPVSALHELPG